MRRLTAVRFLLRCRLAAIQLQSAARQRAAWRELRRRRAAALRIGRMAKGVMPRRQAQRRREAATLIGRVARGRVTRTMMRHVHSMVTAVPSLPRMGSMARFGTRRSRTFGDLFGTRSSTAAAATGSPPAQHRRVARANTMPVRSERGHGHDKGKDASRACVIS